MVSSHFPIKRGGIRSWRFILQAGMLYWIPIGRTSCPHFTKGCLAVRGSRAKNIPSWWTWSKRGPPPVSPSSRRMITFRPFGPRRRRSSSKWRIWISTSRMWKKGCGTPCRAARPCRKSNLTTAGGSCSTLRDIRSVFCPPSCPGRKDAASGSPAVAAVFCAGPPFGPALCVPSPEQIPFLARVPRLPRGLTSASGFD